MSLQQRRKHQAVLRRLFARMPNHDSNGYPLHQFIYKEYPELRKWFKGSENFTEEQIANSEKFHEQGLRILLAMHLCVNTIHDPDLFRAYVRERVLWHTNVACLKGFNDNNDLYKAYWPCYLRFLDEHLEVGVSHEERVSFLWMGDRFTEESQKLVGPHMSETNG